MDPNVSFIEPSPPACHASRPIRLNGGVFLALLLLTPVSLNALQGYSSAGPTACPVQDRTVPTLSLHEAWRAAEREEPGYRAAREDVEGWRSAQAAVAREWFPGLSFDALGDHGLRLSPGEERALGVGPRLEARLLAGWTVLDSDRGARADEAEQRSREATLAGEAFGVEHQAEVARVYLEAGSAERALQLAQQWREELGELAELVSRRVKAGVDREWESTLVEEALARAEAEVSRAEEAHGEAQRELAVLVGECVRAEWPGGKARFPAPERSVEAQARDNPEARRLRQEARAQEAGARAARREDRWRLDVVGGVGPNYSRAFEEDRLRQEYLVGVSGTWDLDLFGVRRQRAAERDAQARALEARAESQELLAARRAGAIRERWEHTEERARDVERQIESASRRIEIARLRWEEGVGPWTDVVDARERLDEARVERLTFQLESMLTLVEYAETVGQLDRLPEWLGQETPR